MMAGIWNAVAKRSGDTAFGPDGGMFIFVCDDDPETNHYVHELHTSAASCSKTRAL